MFRLWFKLFDIAHKRRTYDVTMIVNCYA